MSRYSTQELIRSVGVDGKSKMTILDFIENAKIAYRRCFLIKMNAVKHFQRTNNVRYLWVADRYRHILKLQEKFLYSKIGGVATRGLVFDLI